MPLINPNDERDEGVLLVLSGPSGTGKSTLCQAAMSRFRNLEFSVSFTTRKPRVGELHGKDYYFVDDPTFDKMIAEHRLAEWAVVHGNRYGTSLDIVSTRITEGVNLLLDIDPQGAAQIQRSYPAAVFIFLVPPSPAALEQRLRGRGTEDPDSIARRLHNAHGELQQSTWYDYIIINDEIERAVQKFVAIILAEKCRRSRSSRLLKRLMINYDVVLAGKSPAPP